jgi:hypothetical protein
MLVLNDVVLENIMHKNKGIFTNHALRPPLL